jgi:rare lipoprotein A
MRRRTFPVIPALAVAFLLAGCAGAPTGGPRYKVGSPYLAGGVWYVPREDFAYDAIGLASWYGDREHGRPTANGEIFDQYELSAAHPTLQLPSLAEVTNLENGRMLRLRINDRGPFAGGRILDVSRRAAQLLGFERQGTAMVRVRILPEESLQLALAAGRPAAAPSPPAGPLFVAASLPPGGDPARWSAWAVAALGLAPEFGGDRLRFGPFGDVASAERAVVVLLNAGLADAAVIAQPLAAMPAPPRARL